MLVPRDIMSEINRVLSAIRAGLDAASYPSHIAADHEEIRQAYLRFEEVRFSYRARTSRSAQRYYAQDEAVAELRKALAELAGDGLFMELAHIVRFRPLNMSRPSMGFSLHPGLMETGISVADALNYLLEGLADIPYYEEFSFEDEKSSLSTLRKVVPKRQGLAPVQFSVAGNQLQIAPQRAVALPEDSANTAAAKIELLNRGEKLVEELQQSNCDKRLIDTFKHLCENLQSSDDIIKLGLSNIACEVMRDQFSLELPDAISAMIFAQTTGVGLYVSQFEEWRRFTEKAAMAQISVADAPQIAQAFSTVISRIEDTPSIADAQVPRTLKALIELVNNPSYVTKRTLYAIWRTLENLIITTFNYGAEFLGKTASKTSDKLSTAASRAIVALVSVGLVGAIAVSPIANVIPESAWITKAVEIVKSIIGDVV